MVPFGVVRCGLRVFLYRNILLASFWLIKVVVGRIPVMVNIKVTVPRNYAGHMVYNKPMEQIVLV